jgi:hypothetical protein
MRSLLLCQPVPGKYFSAGKYYVLAIPMADNASCGNVYWAVQVERQFYG